MTENTTPLTIRTLFEEDVRFKVPAYQRAFSWEVEGDQAQLPQFLTDLEEQHPGKEYYLGHFLFETTTTEPGTRYIIDGQQRLTTVVLFFNSLLQALEIRNVTPESPPSGSRTAEMQRLVQTYIKRDGAHRFATVESDNSFLWDILANRRPSTDDASRSRIRLQSATDFFANRFRCNEIRTETLLRWAALIENAAITRHLVSGKVQATQIFAFQNDRGKDLSNLEKLKAFLAYQLYLHSPEGHEGDAIKHLEGRFADIYGRIERIELLDENQVLAHHCTGYLQRWGGSLDAVKKTLGDLASREDKVTWIRTFCSELADTFAHVIALERTAKSNQRIADPIILDHYNSWPILLKLYGILGAELLQDHDRLLLLMERCLFKLQFLHGRCGNGLHGLAKSLHDRGGLPALQRRLEEASKIGFNSGRPQNCDEAFRQSLKSNYQWDRRFRYVLWKHENELREQKDYDFSPAVYMNVVGKYSENTTLDHITPRTPTGITYGEDFSRDYLNNLGNLLLMPHGMNAHFQNAMPVVKRVELENTTLASHRQVAKRIAEHNGWDSEAIARRKQEIEAFALKYWDAELNTVNNNATTVPGPLSAAPQPLSSTSP